MAYSANILGYQFDTVFGLYLTEYEIPSPQPHTNYKNIPGRDGAIDKSEQNGVVKFNDREWNLEFQKTGTSVTADDIPELERELLNKVHGLKGRIIFDDDPNYYWVGRIFVQKVYCENNGLIVVKIKMRTDPYKYGINDIVVNGGAGSDVTPVIVVLSNGRKVQIPSITIVGARLTFAFEIDGATFTKTLTAGEWVLTDLVLYEGETNVSITGYGNVTFRYKDAHL